MSALYYSNTLSWIFRVFAHWNNRSGCRHSAGFTYWSFTLMLS